MPAVYTRARRQMCHLKTKHSNPYPSISLKWMCRLCFWGERSQRQRVIIIQIDIMKKYVCYICINMQIYYDIFIYIFIRNFAYICVIHYLPPTLSQYLFPIKFQPPSTHTPSSRNQGRPWSSLGQNIKPQRSLKWSNLRVVDLALKQAAKHWVSTSTIADCFQTCLGGQIWGQEIPRREGPSGNQPGFCMYKNTSYIVVDSLPTLTVSQVSETSVVGLWHRSGVFEVSLTHDANLMFQRESHQY